MGDQENLGLQLTTLSDMKALYLPRILRVLLAISLFTFAGCNDATDAPESEAPGDAPVQEAPERYDGSAADVPEPASDEIHVLVLGNSIAAGYGLEADQAFPALLQRKAEAEGWSVRVTNAGVSGDTSSGGLNRLPWLLENRVDILLIELGGNDGLRGIDPEVTRNNLSEMIELARSEQEDISIILGTMQVPPNMGSEYAEAFRGLYDDVADEHGVPTVEIVPEDLGSVTDYVQSDGIHPTADGQELIADSVWDVLREKLAPRVKEREAVTAE